MKIGDLVDAEWYDLDLRSSSMGVIISYDIEYHDDDDEYHYEVLLTSGKKLWLPEDCVREFKGKQDENR
tara:strand:+ start:606 stop:812 length:207 start_codon:yes stop_codon:yes gene_type:complete